MRGPEPPMLLFKRALSTEPEYPRGLAASRSRGRGGGLGLIRREDARISSIFRQRRSPPVGPEFLIPSCLVGLRG